MNAHRLKAKANSTTQNSLGTPPTILYDHALTSPDQKEICNPEVKMRSVDSKPSSGRLSYRMM